MESTDYDLIIIGAGLVGSSLAYALKNLPLRIAIVEATSQAQLSASTAFNTRAISLSQASVRTFMGMGVWPALLAKASPITEIHVSERGCFGASHFKSTDVNVAALGYVIPADQINDTLQPGLQHANVTWLYGASLSAMQTFSDGVCVTLQQDGVARQLRGRLLVGCDGANSKTRSCASIPFSKSDFGQTAILTTVELQRPHQGVAFERFTESGPMAFLPLTGQRAALVWSTEHNAARELLAMSTDAFLTRALEQFGYRLGRFKSCSQRHAHPLSATLAKKITADRTILIGNAAHALHPIAGQGFNLGLRDAAVLAHLLRDASKTGIDIGARVLLERYVTLRTDDQKRIALLCDFLPRIYSHRFLPYAWFRSACMLSLDFVPIWKRYFMQHTLGTYGWQPDLACGLPLVTTQ